MDQNARGEALLALHQGPDVLVLPNCWDVGSAVVLEGCGYPAIATTSSGVAHVHGFSDGQHIGRDGMIAAIAEITARVTVPLTTDLEAGYGPSPDDVAETIRQAIQAGSVGANLEDGDKSRDDKLLPVEAAVERIAAARAAADASGVRFVINGRTDPFLFRPKHDPAENFTEAVKRGNALRQAGADCIFVPGALDTETMGRLVKEIDAPINVLAGFSGYTAPPVDELKAAGVRRISTGGGLALAALGALRRMATELKETGRFDYVEDAIPHVEMNTRLA